MRFEHPLAPTSQTTAPGAPKPEGAPGLFSLPSAEDEAAPPLTTPSSLDPGPQRGPGETFCAEGAEEGIPPWEEDPDVWAAMVEAEDEWWRSQEITTAKNKGMLAGEWAAEKLASIELCGEVATLVVRDCGYQQALIQRCHSPLCPDCATLDFWRAAGKYLPSLKAVLKKGKRSGLRARFFTVTVPNCPSAALKPRIQALKAAFGRFKNIRLGRRALRKWSKLFWQALRDSNLSERERRRQIGLWIEFRKQIEILRKKFKRSIMLREVTSGLARIEVKPAEWDVSGPTWHPHLHILMISVFPIPQVLLSIWWTWAFRPKAFSLDDLLVVDARAVTGDPGKVIRYIAKYMGKFEDISKKIPKSDLEAFLWGLRYTRKVQAWGLPVRASSSRKACPACGSEHCGVQIRHPRVFLERRISPRRRVPFTIRWLRISDDGLPPLEGRIEFDVERHVWRWWEGDLPPPDPVGGYGMDDVPPPPSDGEHELPF